MNSIFQIGGIIINTSNGYFIPGLRVIGSIVDQRTRSNNNHYDVSNRDQFVFDEDISNAKGQFNLRYQTIRMLSFLGNDQRLAVVLRVFNTENEVQPQMILQYEISEIVLNNNIVYVTLGIALQPTPLTHDTWKEFSLRLQKARIFQLHHIVRQLSPAHRTQSIFADWSIETRQNLISEIEKAFLDPTGTLRNITKLPGFYDLRDPSYLQIYVSGFQSHLENLNVKKALLHLISKINTFFDLFDVDWAIDLDELGNGNVGMAVDNYQQLYSLKPFAKEVG